MPNDAVAELDIDSAMDTVAAGMNTAADDAPDDSVETTQDAGAPAAAALGMPQSWKKEWETDWKATPRTAQERFIEREKQMLQGLEGYKSDAQYGRTLRDAFKPHMDVLKAQGLNEVQAVQYLLAAHRQLSDPKTNGTYLQKVAQQYGIKVAQQVEEAAAAGATTPEIKTALERLDRIEGQLTESQQREQEQKTAEIGKRVDAFAADPKNIYFDECADDIAKLIGAGYELQEAYDKAVWANPVTRQKEIGRMQQEQADKAKQAAIEAAKKAKKGTAVNVRSRDTARTPTEPAGTMDETMKETLADIKSRT